MVTFIKVYLKMVKDVELVHANLELQVLFIEENGGMINHMEMEFYLVCRMKLSKLDLRVIKSLMGKSKFYSQTVNFMKEISSIIFVMALEFIITKTVIHMMVSGKMTGE